MGDWPAWVATGVSALIGAAFSAGGVFMAVRKDLESHDHRLTELEERELAEKFVTRREFELTVQNFRDDIREVRDGQKEISAGVTAIRDFLLQNIVEGDPSAENLDPS